MRAFGFLVLIVCVILGVGLYLGWFTVSASALEGSRPNVELTIDKQKMKSDVAGMKDKVQSLVSEKTVSGLVRRIQPHVRELTVVDAASHEVVIRVTATTDIKLGDRSGSIDDIRADDPVTVVYEEGKGENVARKINIARRS